MMVWAGRCPRQLKRGPWLWVWAILQICRGLSSHFLKSFLRCGHGWSQYDRNSTKSWFLIHQNICHVLEVLGSAWVPIFAVGWTARRPFSGTMKSMMEPILEVTLHHATLTAPPRVFLKPFLAFFCLKTQPESKGVSGHQTSMDSAMNEGCLLTVTSNQIKWSPIAHIPAKSPFPPFARSIPVFLERFIYLSGPRLGEGRGRVPVPRVGASQRYFLHSRRYPIPST